MITADMIAFILASFCQLKNPKITKTHKLECIEYLSNCSIGPNGETTKKLLNQCREQWVEIERNKK